MKRSATWGTGRVYRPVIYGKPVLIWWLDYSVRGVRIRESSKTRDYDAACRMIPERKAITAQVLQMSGNDIAPHQEPIPPARKIEPEILTPQEVATWLKCSRRQLATLSIPRLAWGHRSLRYFRNDVIAWLNQHRTELPHDTR